MYIVNKDTKKTIEVQQTTFKELGLKERKDLQEWIANNPIILGEDILIIQKEFSGFSDTNERLDLLALDHNGNIVVIENKLDNSGSNVVRQAMKYAGYCSSLKKNDIKDIYQQYINKTGIIGDAESNIMEFLNVDDRSEVYLNKDLTQRIILVAKEFRKEVTNTVIRARKYGIKIQCIKITPYEINGQLFIDSDQIIPVKDIQDIMISYDEKAHEDMQDQEHLNNAKIVRNKFRHNFLPKFNKKSNIFSGRTIDDDVSITDHWFSAGSGLTGVPLCFVVTKDYCSVELSISRNHVKDYNKSIYDFLFSNKSSIESKFGDSLIWERLDDKIMSRISYKLCDVSIFREEDWNKMMNFLTENMIKFEASLRPYINSYKAKKITN